MSEEIRVPIGASVERDRTSWKDKMKYSLGDLPDSVYYNIFYIYFMYFLTDVAGVSPAHAGFVYLIVILWDAITDPIIGYVSDHWKGKNGRRRPFIFVGVIGASISMILLFISVDFGATGNFLYYVIVGVIFFTTYTMYIVPFLSFGAELTNNFDDRNTIRVILGIPIFLAGWMVTAGSMQIWNITLKVIGEKTSVLWMNADQVSWVVIAIILAVIALICGLVFVKVTKGKEIVDTAEVNVVRESSSALSFFKNMKDVAGLKVIWILLGLFFFYTMIFSITASAQVYLMSNNMGLSESAQSLFWTIYAFFTIAQLPLINIVSNKIGKKTSMIIYMAVCILSCVFFYFHDIRTMMDMILFQFFFGFGNVAFWTIGVSMQYDLVEVDVFTSGQRREGVINGIVSFSMKLGPAVAMSFTGLLLTAVGYDGSTDVQTAAAEEGILKLNTIIPAFMLIICIVFLVIFPITKKRYTQLLEITKKKEAGEEYSTKGLEKLLPKKYWK